MNVRSNVLLALVVVICCAVVSYGYAREGLSAAYTPDLDSLERHEAAPFAHSVMDYGAVGDGVSMDTDAIRSAVEACADRGGGTVYFPAGTYLTGTIVMKSGVHLYLDPGSVILGSPDLADYPDMNIEFVSLITVNRSLIHAEKVRDIAITGHGVIDGNRDALLPQDGTKPFMFHFIECDGVTVRDITLRDSSAWGQHYLACNDVLVDGVTIRSYFSTDTTNWGKDGIDIDSSTNVRIANCDIESGDDCIVLKSTSPRVTRNVTVTNCVLRTFAHALKLGTETTGGFANIAISNCAVYDAFTGLDLMIVDGGSLDQVVVTNITMDNVKGAIFMRLGNRARPYAKGVPKPDVGTFANVIVSNVIATNVDSLGCSITGIPGHPVRNVALDNISIAFIGGGSHEEAAVDVPELEDTYPSNHMFGILPAYGFYCRHVENIRFDDVSVTFDAPDMRPAMICDDVTEIELDGFIGRITPDTREMLRFTNVRGAFIHGCRPRGPVSTFLRIEGALSDDITVMNNDFGSVGTVCVAADGARSTAWTALNNRN